MSAGNRGFINFGATCYLNSALQCLSHIDILNDDNFREQVKKYKKNDTPLLDEWFDLQDKMWSDDHDSAIHAMDFIKVFMNKCREKSIEFNSLHLKPKEFVSKIISSLYFFKIFFNLNPINGSNSYSPLELCA